MQRHLRSMQDEKETKSKTIETQTNLVSTHQEETKHFIPNEVPTNQRAVNGIKQNFMNQIHRWKRR